MDFIPAKQVLSKTKNQGWFGTDYTLNLYRGCSHGCVYCDSRSECYRVESFDEVRAKDSAIDLLEKELGSKRSKGIVGMGAMSDPYNPMESRYELTAKAIEAIGRNGFGLTVTTKSALIQRDIDRLKAVANYSPVLCKITLTSVDEALCRKIEPRVSTPLERLDAVARLSDSGLMTGVLMMPVLPFISDDPKDIVAVVKASKEAGAKFIYPGMGVTLRDRQRDHFYQALDRDFPGLKERYVKTFGDSYGCGANNAKALYSLFAKTCEALGLLYKMKDIIHLYQAPYEQEQISFF